MSGGKNLTAYWKVFRTIDSARFIDLQNGSVKNLLRNYKLLFGKTDEYKSLKGQYKDRLRKMYL
jgi:hypothetical protein